MSKPARGVILTLLSEGRPGNRGFHGVLPPGQSVLWTLLGAHVPVSYACMDAICGRDRIRVLRGADLLNEIEPHERYRLDAIGAGPGCRLACQCRLAEDASEGEILIELADD